MELGRQDSNLGSRDQNPLPYHLATPHRYVCRPRTGLRRPHGQSPYGLQIGVASDALALGYAQTQWSLSRRREPSRHPESLIARAEEQDQRDGGEKSDDDQRQGADDEHEDRH